MVGKKLLSLISLLFAGSQLISVARADCTYTKSDNSGDITITSCADGEFILKGDESAVISSASECTETNKCYLVVCDNTASHTCDDTNTAEGYVKFGNDVFSCNNKQCVHVTAPGYYTNIGTGNSDYPIIKFNGSTASTVDTATITTTDTCDGKKAGAITDSDGGVKFCSTDNEATPVVISSGDDYRLITIEDAAAEPFNVGGSANTKVLVKVGNKAVIKVTEHGYYLNALDTGTTPVIKCNTDGCTTPTDQGTCTDKELGNVAVISGKAYYCTASNQKVEIVADDAKVYSIFTVPASENSGVNPITGEANGGEAQPIIIESGNGKSVAYSGTFGTDFPSDGSKFLVYDVDGTLSHKGSSVSVTSTGSAFTFSSGADGKNLCVDQGAKIWARSDAICHASSDCVYYYDCEEGVCTFSEKNERGVTSPVPFECVPGTPDENCVEGYYIADDDGSDLIGDTSDGYLWHCADGRCRRMDTYIGYFDNKVDNKPNIKCVLNSVQKCNRVSNIAYGNCENVGDIVTTAQNGDDYQICLTTGGPGTVLSTVNNKSFMTAIHQSNGLYGLTPNDVASNASDAVSAAYQYYLVVKVKGRSVRVFKESTPVRYRYTNKSTEYQIYGRGEGPTGDGDMCKDGAPYEYKLDQWTTTVKDDTLADYYIHEN